MRSSPRTTGPAFDREMLSLARANWGCAPAGTLRFSPVLFAGGMAETLLRARLGGGDLAPLVAFDPAAPHRGARRGATTAAS